MRKLQNPEIINAIVSRYKAGETTQQIADSFGTSISTINRRLISAGIAIRKRKDYYNASKDAEVVDSYKLGESMASISSRTGMCQ